MKNFQILILFSCNLLVLSNINHCDIKYGVRCGVYYETYCGGGSHCSPSGWCSYSLAYQIHSANSIYSRKFSACYRNDLNSIYIVPKILQKNIFLNYHMGQN